MKLHIPVPLRWADLDAYGHVNNTDMLRILEEARITAFWTTDAERSSTAVLQGGPHADTRSLIARQEIEYLAPAGFTRKPLDVSLWVSRLGGASLDICYEIASPAEVEPHTLFARARTTLVLVDATTNRPRRLGDVHGRTGGLPARRPVAFLQRRAAGGTVAGHWRQGGGPVAWSRNPTSQRIEGMNETQIAHLRQSRGWTQERLAEVSGVGVRTIQRIESGSDASLETLSLIASALDVQVSELFSHLDETGLGEKVESYEARAAFQQQQRRTAVRSWHLLYIGLGLAVTIIAIFAPVRAIAAFLPVILLVYWLGGFFVMRAIQNLVVEPRLDVKYPLSRSAAQLRAARRAQYVQK